MIFSPHLFVNIQFHGFRWGNKVTHQLRFYLYPLTLWIRRVVWNQILRLEMVTLLTDIQVIKLSERRGVSSHIETLCNISRENICSWELAVSGLLTYCCSPTNYGFFIGEGFFYLREMPLSSCCSSLLLAPLLNKRYLHFATDSCRLVRVIWFLIEPINKTRVSFLYKTYLICILQRVINSWSIT